MGGTGRKPVKTLSLKNDRVPGQCTPNMHTTPESVERDLSNGTAIFEKINAQNPVTPT